MSDSLQPQGQQPARLVCPWDSPSKNTEVGCHAFLHGIFPTQVLNPCLLWLLHCRQFLYHWQDLPVYSSHIIVCTFSSQIPNLSLPTPLISIMITSSSLTRDSSWAVCFGSMESYHWTTRGVPRFILHCNNARVSGLGSLYIF